MNKLRLLIATALLLTLTSCATTTRSVLLGATIGEVTGGVTAYYMFRHGSTATMIGAGTGALAGGLIGYWLRKKPAQENKQPVTTTNNISQIQPEGDSLPSLTKPQIRILWVPDKIEGNKFVRGHYIYVIDKESKWSQ